MANGKKVALYGCLGCGGLILLVVLVLAGGIGFISYQGYQFGKEIGESYKVMVNKYTDLDQQYPFTPPNENLLDEARLKTYVQIRSQLAVLAREKADQLAQTGEEIGENFDSPGIVSKIHGAKKIAAVVRQAAKLASDIGTEHVLLLNNEKMSTNEYQWITKVFLGTLAKAPEADYPEQAKQWNTFLDAFDQARKRMGNVDIHTGNQNFRGNDMNREKLLKALEDVPFLEANMNAVTQNLDQLIPDNEIGILDYFTLYLDEIFLNERFNPTTIQTSSEPTPETP